MAIGFDGVERLISREFPSLWELHRDNVELDSERAFPAAGDYVDPYSIIPTLQARRTFLKIAAELAPEIVVDLRDNVFPVFLRSSYPCCADIMPEIWKWGERAFKIQPFVGGSWVHDSACTTLEVWAAAREQGIDDRIELTLVQDSINEFMFAPDWARAELGKERKPERIVISKPEWNPFTESRRDAERRTDREFRRQREARMDEIEARLRQDGAAPSPVAPKLRDHLAWLVRYQVRGESFASIAQDVGRTRQGVTEAVHGAARFIFLPLRPSRPGRPKKHAAQAPQSP